MPTDDPRHRLKLQLRGLAWQAHLHLHDCPVPHYRLRCRSGENVVEIAVGRQDVLPGVSEQQFPGLYFSPIEAAIVHALGENTLTGKAAGCPVQPAMHQHIPHDPE